MNIERKSFDIKADMMDSSMPGMIHAVVSVFGNEDSAGDVMVKGAFANSINAAKQKGKFPPGVWSHDWQRPVAKTMDAFETNEGLNVIAQFNLDTQDGRDAYSNVKNGLFTEYSFGFCRVEELEKDGITYVQDVLWYEWSPVLVGCNPDTYTVSVKRYDRAELETERDWERFLRDAGALSRKQATAFVLHGFKGLQRDADEAKSAEQGEPAPAKPEPNHPPAPSEALAETQNEEPPTEAAPLLVPAVAKADSRDVAALHAHFLTVQARLLRP